jgi:hypothetical protein
MGIRHWGIRWASPGILTANNFPCLIFLAGFPDLDFCPFLVVS